MKIAIVVSTFPPYRGGMGNAAAAHADALRARGHEVTVFSPETSRAWFRWGNAAVLPDAISRAQEFDVVLLEYPCFGTAELLALRRTNNLVLYYHMDVVGRGIFKLIFSLHRRLVLPFILRRARRIMVSSWDYARASYLTAIPPTGAWDQKVVVVPLAVDTNRFTPAPLTTNGRRVLMIGGLDRPHYFKGLTVLLRAMRDVPGATLTVVGDGELRGVYEKQAYDFGITDRVRFIGRVQDDTLPDVYRAADVLILPSTDRSEAFGLVLLEAQACGVPVIASDLPGVRTALENGTTGFLVPPGDVAALSSAIRTLLDDPSRRETLGTTAREYIVSKFDNRLLGERLERALSS